MKEAITGGFADSRTCRWAASGMGGESATARYRARMSVQLKDLRNALDTASEIGFDAPITALIRKLNADAIEHGLTDRDHAGSLSSWAQQKRYAMRHNPACAKSRWPVARIRLLWG